MPCDRMRIEGGRARFACRRWWCRRPVILDQQEAARVLMLPGLDQVTDDRLLSQFLAGLQPVQTLY